MPERRFTRLRPEADPDRLVFQVPGQGMCISTFLVLRPSGQPRRVLLGHMNPEAPWSHLGAVDPTRLQVWSKGWMLPSSQLIFYESPEEAAHRIAREQLGIELGALPTPVLMSDTTRRIEGSDELHWDMGFVYVLDGQEEPSPRPAAWADLRYVDVSRVPRSEFVRFHDDVLRLAGIACAD